MRTATRKDVLTTGEVARVCRVAPRTVSKWFDTGKLRGYRIPGSRDRRIPLQQLVAFMRAHDIPLDGLNQGACRVLVLSSSFPADVAAALDASDRYELRQARNGFEAGMIAQEFRPHVIVVDVADVGPEAETVCRLIKGAAELGAARVLAAVEAGSDETPRRLLSAGFDGSVPKPLTMAGLAAAVEAATNLIT